MLFAVVVDKMLNNLLHNKNKILEIFVRLLSGLYILVYLYITSLEDVVN